jgi:hypothetical protein
MDAKLAIVMMLQKFLFTLSADYVHGRMVVYLYVYRWYATAGDALTNLVACWINEIIKSQFTSCVYIASCTPIEGGVCEITSLLKRE